MRIIAHRGKSGSARENTLAAIDQAWACGADGIEVDVRVTADGAIVVIHDDDTARVAGRRLIVKKSTLQQLRALDLGCGANIPTLEEVFLSTPQGKQVYVEAKSCLEVVHRLGDVIDNCKIAPEKTVFIGFVLNSHQHETMAGLKHMFPDRELYLLFGAATERWVFDGDDRARASRMIEKVRAIGAEGVDVTGKAVTADLIQIIKREGLSMHVWDIDDPLRARQLRAAGVDSITTDKPALLKTSLGDA